MSTSVIPIDFATSTKAEQNRINAQHSTGPKTEAGKKRSSLNALKHGFCSHVVVLPSENLEAFKNFVLKCNTIYRPEDERQAEVVQRIADCRWRLNRCGALESNLFTLGHEANADRFHVDDDKEESQAIQAGLAAADTFRRESDIFLRLGLFEQRLLKQYKEAITELNHLQEQSRARLKEESDELLRVRNLHKEKKRSFSPAEFGFVSKPERIEMFFRRHDAKTNGILPENELLE